MASSTHRIGSADRSTRTVARPWRGSIRDSTRIALPVLVGFAMMLPLLGFGPIQTVTLTHGGVVVPYWSVIERYFVHRFD